MNLIYKSLLVLKEKNIIEIFIYIFIKIVKKLKIKLLLYSFKNLNNFLILLIRKRYLLLISSLL